MAIDTSNIDFINYLWTKKNDDNTISGIRLSKNNLPTDTVYRGDIPAVNNGTLTIQKNGTNVATFTANSSTNQTANIIVPTKVSDLNNDKGFLTAHQSIKSLNTNNNSTLTVNSSETIAGSGSISLNGIAKTAQEEYLQWGGPSKSGAVSPIGMTLSNEHSANRMAFINGDLITAEYSSDGGTTWTVYSANAAAKSQFFTKSYTFAVGRPNESTEVIADKSKTRITITAQNGNNPSGRVYTDPRKMLVLISSATGLELLVEYRTGTNYKNNGAWTTFGTYSLSGWSGWNDIPLVLNTIGGGSTQTNNNWQLRLTFTVKTKSASYPKTASILAARIYGQNTWTTPSTMAETGHMYTFDMSKNVTFPAGISATSFTEGGTSLANKYIAKSLTSTKGDMIYASAANTPARLGIGSNGQFLSIADGIPKWVNNPNTHNSHAIISGTKSDNSTQIKGSASSGDITLGDSGVTAGTYRSVTVNSKGIVVAGSQTDNDTNTWRKIQLNGTDKLGTGTNTNPLNIKAGSNMTITESNGTFTFAATDTNTTYSAGTGLQLSGTTFSTKLNNTTSLGTIGTTAKLYAVGVDDNGKLCVNVPWTDTNTDTHYTNYLQIKGNGTEAVKFTQNADKSLNLKPGSNVSISAASGEITISSTDTNTSHNHSAGVGLVGSGSAGTSGTYTYKAKLRSETALTVDSAAATTTSERVYPVAVDKSGYLSVNVPWTDTTYTFNGAVSTIKDSNLTASRALISNSSGKVAVSDITSTELSYLDGVSSNIQTQLDTLLSYSDENGYAKVAVNAHNDSAGHDIIKTYATKNDLNLKQPKTLENTGISISYDGTIISLTTVEDAIETLADYVSSCYKDIKHWTPIEVNCARGVNISNFSLTDDLLTIIYNQIGSINDYERDLYINFDDGVMVLRLDHRNQRTGSDKCLLYTGHCEKDNVIYKVYLLLKDTGSTLTQTAVRIEEYATVS